MRFNIPQKYKIYKLERRADVSLQSGYEHI